MGENVRRMLQPDFDIFLSPLFYQLQTDVQWMSKQLGFDDPAEARFGKLEVYANTQLQYNMPFHEAWQKGEHQALGNDLRERISNVKTYVPVNDEYWEETFDFFLDGKDREAHHRNMMNVMKNVYMMVKSIDENLMVSFGHALARLNWLTCKKYRVDLSAYMYDFRKLACLWYGKVVRDQGYVDRAVDAFDKFYSKKIQNAAKGLYNFEGMDIVPPKFLGGALVMLQQRMVLREARSPRFKPLLCVDIDSDNDERDGGGNAARKQNKKRRARRSRGK